MSTFETLNNINVNDYTEMKGHLTYLSWSKAWEEVKKRYPDATYAVVKNDRGLPYFLDKEVGCMVMTNVTIEGETLEMWLPVMDYRNKTIMQPTATDINKTIMRCLTKNLAMFGLGLYIYSGEDLPNQEKDPAKDEPIDNVKINVLKNEMERTGVTELKLFSTIGVKSWGEINTKGFTMAMNKFKKTPDKEEK